MLKKSLMLLLILLILSSFPLFSNNNEAELTNTIELLIKSNEELIEKIEYLEKENKTLNENNLLLYTKFSESTELIKELRNVIAEDLEEIKHLRKVISSVSAQVSRDMNMTVGLGVSYPLGGSALFTVRPKNFPVGGFIDVNINKTTGAFVSVGVAYSF